MPRKHSTLYEVRHAARAQNYWRINGYPDGHPHQFWFPTEKAAKAQAEVLNFWPGVQGLVGQLTLGDSNAQ